MKRVCIVLLVCLFFAACAVHMDRPPKAAQADADYLAKAPTPPKTPDVAGVWSLTIQTPRGELTADVTFIQDKEAIKVSTMSLMNMELNGEGTIKGQELQWTWSFITQAAELIFGLKAKLDGDTMTGELVQTINGIIDTSPLTFSAKKKK